MLTPKSTSCDYLIIKRITFLKTVITDDYLGLHNFFFKVEYLVLQSLYNVGAALVVLLGVASGLHDVDVVAQRVKLFLHDILLHSMLRHVQKVIMHPFIKSATQNAGCQCAA